MLVPCVLPRGGMGGGGGAGTVGSSGLVTAGGTVVVVEDRFHKTMNRVVSARTAISIELISIH